MINKMINKINLFLYINKVQLEKLEKLKKYL